MGIFGRLFGKKPRLERGPNAPFMEHPTGDFQSAVDAMADAIERLRALPEWNDWITFCAQGMGDGEESIHHAEIRMRQNELQLEKSLDAELVTRRAGVPRSSLAVVGANYFVGHPILSVAFA